MPELGDLLRSSKAICLDLDGTLIDSIGVLEDCYYHFLEIHDAIGSEDEFQALNGFTIPEVVSELVRIHNLTGTVSELEEIYMHTLIPMYAKCSPMPGADELLAFLLSADMRVALVSSAVNALIEPVINKHNWGRFFERVVSGDMVENSKPYPDAYQKAAELFGLKPESDLSIAVEDSYNGVISASTANMLVIAIGQDERLKSGGASFVVSNLHELTDLLSSNIYYIEGITNNTTKFEFSNVEKSFSGEIVECVDRIWDVARQANHALFDGEILTVIDSGDSHFQCCKTYYRFFYAKQIDWNLGRKLDINSLSVSGLCESSGAVLFGKRSLTGTQYRGYYELVPSGSVTLQNVNASGKIDCLEQLLVELEEESGFTAGDVIDSHYLGLFQDRQFSCLDVCINLKLADSARERDLKANEEYEELTWIEFEDIEKKMEEFRLIVPTTVAILRECNLENWRKNK